MRRLRLFDIDQENDLSIIALLNQEEANELHRDIVNVGPDISRSLIPLVQLKPIRPALSSEQLAKLKQIAQNLNQPSSIKNVYPLQTYLKQHQQGFSGFKLFCLRNALGENIATDDGDVLYFSSRQTARQVRDKLAKEFGLQTFITKSFDHDHFR